MDKRERFINWIGIPLSQPIDKISEMFYFDRKLNLFFSIHVADYFMLNENFEIDNAVTTSYSKKTENEIASWILRIEQEDKQIKYIPQKGLTDEMSRKVEAENFLHELNIDFEKAEIWKVGEKVTVGINLKKPELGNSRRWWRFWK